MLFSTLESTEASQSSYSLKNSSNDSSKPHSHPQYHSSILTQIKTQKTHKLRLSISLITIKPNQPLFNSQTHLTHLTHQKPSQKRHRINSSNSRQLKHNPQKITHGLYSCNPSASFIDPTNSLIPILSLAE